MAKAKETPARNGLSKRPAKGPAVKAPSKADLSKELVSDSDDEQNLPKATNTAAKKSSTPKQANGSVAKPIVEPQQEDDDVSGESDEDSGDEETENDSEGGSDDGSEEESEASEESEEQKAMPAQSAPKKPVVTLAHINGVKRKADQQSSSDEESSDESDSDEPPQPQTKKAKTMEGSSAESEDESDDSQEAESLPAVKVPSKPAPSKSSTASKSSAPSNPSPEPQIAATTIKPIAPQQFKPPKGYSPLPKVHPNPTFTPANLSGKEIWHITAPASLPLSTLTTLSPESLQSGATVLTHKGIPYTLRPAGSGLSSASDEALPQNPLSLLLPDASHDGSANYLLAPISVSRTLHLRPQLALPNLASAQVASLTGSEAAATVSAPPVSTIRPQPKNLRMRYRPPGFGKGSAGVIGSGSEGEDGDEEEMTEMKGTVKEKEKAKKKRKGDKGGEAQFQFPKALGAHGITTEEDARREGKNTKKEKKGKGVNGEEKRSDEGVNGVEEDEQRRKEEKRARKEEKKAKKEAKAKAREVVDAATK